MKKFWIFSLVLILSLGGCKKIDEPAADAVMLKDNQVVVDVMPPSEPEPRKRIPIPDDYIKLSKGYSSDDWEPEKHVEILCDPKAHRLSVNINPPEFRPDSGFAERKMMKIDDYFYSHGNFRGDQGYAGSFIGYEPCGDYVVAITGEKFNHNWRGREGAINNFVSVRLENDFTTVYPGPGNIGYGVGNGVALTNEWIHAPNRVELDDTGCPQLFATRIDAFPDMKAKKTRLNIFVQAPDQPLLEYPLIKEMDYTVCNETVLGGRTSIIHWQQREIDGDL